MSKTPSESASYVGPKARPYFEQLSIDLKNQILERGVRLCSLTDLIRCLEAIVDEDGAA